MPLATERLNPGSSGEVIRQSIAEAIQQCMTEGERSQEEWAAIANETARRATRNGSGGSAQRKIRAGLGDN